MEDSDVDRVNKEQKREEEEGEAEKEEEENDKEEQKEVFCLQMSVLLSTLQKPE